MSLTNDYFLLYHGKKIDQTTTYETNDSKSLKDFFDISALILSASRKDYEKFIHLDSFKSLLSQITRKEVKNLEDLNQCQYCLLQSIENDTQKDHIDKLHLAFEYLHRSKIINEMNLNKLISLFDPEELGVCDEINVSDDINIETKLSFQDNKNILEDTIVELSDIFSSLDLKDELKDNKIYLNTQKFSIGITGVMNAGKSTMLNALMGQEILGSAVVPETANLTIVKHGKPGAKVFYWNKKEWDKIENSAKSLEAIKDFVNETHKIFGDDLKDIIQEESLCEEVDIHNLAAYTSAEASGKKCNLVKYVELKSDLNFLENGIEIVDTPGLDDPVIQREEITKEYLAKCDLMLHLMNVSQSATLKDVDFIIDALLYQNITKLLIVITRADTVSREQLDEVINYTKSSIKKQLQTLNKDSSLDYILKSIKFIPISGKMALLHRTGKSQEAIDAGFNLEDTGILEIEEYLNETLFGANSSKSDLIIKSAKNKLLKTIKKEIKAFNYELLLLGKSKEELEDDLIIFNKKKLQNEIIFKTMNDDIRTYKNDANEYIKTLESFIINELIDLQNIIRQRVFSDVKYSYEKDKKRPENSRIKVIIQTAIKDGIIDVIRDYRYKFIKKSQNIAEICEQKYKDYGFSLGKKNEGFNAMGFFQDDFKNGFLTDSNDVLISKLLNEVKVSKASKLDILDRSMQTHIKEEFSFIENSIKEKANQVAIILIDTFFKALAEPLETFESKLRKDEQILQNALKTFENNESNKDELTITIHKKIKKLENIKKGLK
ncbi:MAG: dynamin family protein [Campylobacteraceae bacterium]|nr:dynamin family protein [Campylobacteraceae bacterium]